jgi:hypothetical protein
MKQAGSMPGLANFRTDKAVDAVTSFAPSSTNHLKLTCNPIRVD